MYRLAGKSFTYFLFTACLFLAFFRPVLIEGGALNLPNFLSFGLSRTFLKATYFMTNASNLVGFQHWLMAKIAERAAGGPGVLVLRETEGSFLLARYSMEGRVLVCRDQQLNGGRILGFIDSLYEHRPLDLDRIRFILLGPRMLSPRLLNFYRLVLELLKPEVLFCVQFLLLAMEIFQFQNQPDEDVSTHYLYVLAALSLLSIFCYQSFRH